MRTRREQKTGRQVRGMLLEATAWSGRVLQHSTANKETSNTHLKLSMTSAQSLGMSPPTHTPIHTTDHPSMKKQGIQTGKISNREDRAKGKRSATHLK